MSTPEELRRQADAVAKVRALRVNRDNTVERANRLLKQAMRDAISLGASVRDVAAAANLSRQRIYQLVHEDDQGSGK